MSAMNAREYSGLWWLPSNEDDKVVGTCAVSRKSRIRLKLIGSFGRERFLPRDRLYTVVLGFASNGTRITLENCHVVQQGISFPGFHVLEVSAERAFLGAHFPEPSAVRFTAAQVQYSYLLDWLRPSGFQVEYKREADTGRPLEYHAKYRTPEKLTVATTAGEISTEYSFQAPLPLGHVHELTMREYAALRLDAAGPMIFEDVNAKFIWPLQNLLIFATDRPNVLSGLTLTVPNDPRDRKETESPEMPIEVVFRQTVKEEEEQPEIRPEEMIFSFPEWQGDFGELIKRWLEIWDKGAWALVEGN